MDELVILNKQIRGIICIYILSIYFFLHFTYFSYFFYVFEVVPFFFSSSSAMFFEDDKIYTYQIQLYMYINIVL